MAGFGVQSGDLTKAAGTYDAEGTQLISMKASITPGVTGAGFGRKFQAVAAEYKTFFDQFGTSVEKFGKEATGIATRLKDVAKTYESTEASTSSQFKG
ncbi:WXG100 family type VII secretion target [Lentzea sp. NPDC051213]|uniref:WXG100 family type VII secretion target n=1 Tax=Lentzea sp. NPDC051213 TaxID=3364126 RepID=UPI0037ABC318